MCAANDGRPDGMRRMHDCDGGVGMSDLWRSSQCNADRRRFMNDCEKPG